MTAQSIGNRYQILQKLGEGGMGIVYKVHDRLNEQVLALKQVQVAPSNLQFTTLNSDSDGVLALTLEFRLLASLRHPHIVSVLDYGFDALALPYYTMQYLEDARSLLDYGKNLPKEEKVQLLIESLQALIYLHRHGIIHRDLKPANVLVASDKSVKVMDFGLALKHEQAAEDKQSLAGTLAYMAPELFSESPASVQSDLYAIALIAYELFVGQHPFSANNTVNLLSNILTTTADTSMLDSALAEVLDKGLSKAPEQRYQNAQEFIQALCQATGRAIPEESAVLRESFLQASAFVGREKELEELRSSLKESMQGKGKAYLVAGESGIGKSRLLDELRSRALVEGAMVLRGQAVAEGGLPFQLWRDVLRRLILSLELSDLEASVLKTIVPNIANLLNRPVADASQLDARASVQRLSLTIMDVFKRSQQPLVLMLEDLHWSSESLEPLKQLLPFVQDFPWLIIGSYRDDEMPDLPERLAGMQVMKLARLSENAISDMAQGILGESGKKQEVLALLKRETEGNAFFMVEVLRALAQEAGALSAIGQSVLPATVFAGGVQAVVRRRLERLPEWTQKALKLAAVAGRELDLAVMQACLKAFNWDDFLSICAETAVMELSESRWRFSHDKLRESVLSDLKAEERSSAYRLVAEAIESVYPQDETRADVLVEHWYQAGDKQKTLHYTFQSLGRLVHITADYAHAKRLIERGLSMDETKAEKRHHARLLALLGDIEEKSGNFDEAKTHYELSLVEAGEITELQASILNGLCKISWRHGQHEKAEQQAKRALELAKDRQDHFNHALSLNNLGNISDDLGKFAEAEAYYKESLAIRREIGDKLGIAASLNNLGIMASDRGDWAEATSRYQESMAMRREIGDRRGIAVVLNNLGILASINHNFSEAIKLYEESLEIYRQIGDRQGVANNLTNLGFARFNAGQSDTARSAWLESLRISQEIDEIDLLLEGMVGAANLRFRLGDSKNAAILAGYVEAHPVASYETKHIFLEPLLKELKAAMSKEDLESAFAEAKSLEFEKLLAELLTELED